MKDSCVWAEIDLSALERNFKFIKRQISPGVKILGVVKSDAYGHGLLPISRRLLKLGVDYLGVGNVEEAILLREDLNSKIPILILGNILPQQAGSIAKYDLTQALCNMEIANCLNREAKRRKKTIKIHLKVDTGMGRVGIWHEDALKFIRNLKKLNFLKLEGVFTHLSCADTDRSFTDLQIRLFRKLLKKLKDEKFQIKFQHAANSAGLIGFKNSHFNLVRPGLLIYGACPKDKFIKRFDLKPVLNLKAKVIFVKRVPPGRSISYGRSYTTTENTKIATLPFGYAHGYPRSLSNKAKVLIKGKRFPIVGRVCMDQTMVDIGREMPVRIGEEAVLIGRQGKELIRVEELARLAETIPYELLCSIGSGVNRFYKS